MKNIYLDFAAATPVDERVIEAMQPFWSAKFHNPSAIYLAAREAKEQLQHARESVALWLGARSSEVIFTAGATEANNIAVHGVMSIRPDSNIVVSSIEHDAILVPANDYQLRTARVDERGLVDAEELKALIDGSTTLVSIIYANNEIGTIQHMQDIAQIIAEERQARQKAGNSMPIWLHTDASQAANFLDLHVDKLGVDLMTLNGGKMYGPKQSGALYVRAGVQLAPWTAGGGQEKGIRSGTENIAFAVGLAKALEIAQTMRKEESHRLENLRSKLANGIISAFDDAILLGHGKQHLPNLVAAIIPRIDGERVVMMCDEAGIQIGTGSACSAMSDEPSHVVTALGFSAEDANNMLRFSMGRTTTEDDIEQVLSKLPIIIETARQLS